LTKNLDDEIMGWERSLEMKATPTNRSIRLLNRLQRFIKLNVDLQTLKQSRKRSPQNLPTKMPIPG